jgi:hypothetical protein
MLLARAFHSLWFLYPVDQLPTDQHTEPTTARSSRSLARVPRHLARPSEPHTPFLRPLAALAGPRPDQLTLEP